MSAPLHPAAVLYQGTRQFPALTACEHYAGSEKLIRKALQLQQELSPDSAPIFDITADCEDGAPAGREIEHARMIGALLNDPANLHGRIGVRIHDAGHAHWREELEIIIELGGERVAYIVLPKATSADDVMTQISALESTRHRHGVVRGIPVHVLIETPGALHEVWRIAGLPHVESLDFGLMDFVSAHHGAIPATAMRSPGQFSHPLISRAKCEIAAAALAHSIVPSHNVTTELRDSLVVGDDARRARNEFGYLRMWSIHPSQILPIVEAMRPDFNEVEEACGILTSAQDADWGPIRFDGKLHDRASYRYYWELLRRARATAMPLNQKVLNRFFSTEGLS